MKRMGIIALGEVRLLTYEFPRREAILSKAGGWAGAPVPI